MIFSDGLDTKEIKELHELFSHQIRVSFGWGTLLTNDFRNLEKQGKLDPFSLVCKATKANGVQTVKLSDNPNKAMGPNSLVARYKEIFDVGHQESLEVLV